MEAWESLSQAQDRRASPDSQPRVTQSRAGVKGRRRPPRWPPRRLCLSFCAPARQAWTQPEPSPTAPSPASPDSARTGSSSTEPLRVEASRPGRWPGGPARLASLRTPSVLPLGSSPCSPSSPSGRRAFAPAVRLRPTVGRRPQTPPERPASPPSPHSPPQPCLELWGPMFLLVVGCGPKSVQPQASQRPHGPGMQGVF